MPITIPGYFRALASGITVSAFLLNTGVAQSGYGLPVRVITLSGTVQPHVTGGGDPFIGRIINFTSPDAWLFLDNIAPSTVASTLVKHFQVNGAAAALDANIRIAQYGRRRFGHPPWAGLSGDDRVCRQVIERRVHAAAVLCQI